MIRGGVHADVSESHNFSTFRLEALIALMKAINYCKTLFTDRRIQFS